MSSPKDRMPSTAWLQRCAKAEGTAAQKEGSYGLESWGNKLINSSSNNNNNNNDSFVHYLSELYRKYEMHV